MPRVNIPLINNEIYHIYNRGVEKRIIFLEKSDYIRFYQSLTFFNTKKPTQNFRLAQSAKRDRGMPLVRIQAYCLLPNHFHLLLSQVVDGGISEFIKRLSGGYTNYFNEKYERTGALFGGTFKRVHVSTEAQKQYLFAYINENHYVHNIKVDREVIHTSSLHYQNRVQSKAINTGETSQVYDLKNNIALAQQIYKQRRNEKTSDLLER